MDKRIQTNKKVSPDEWYTPRELLMKLGHFDCDPCAGSGTTAVACHRTKRHFIGFEINEEYHKKAVKRLQAEQAQLILDF